jgi:hypothetical protein
MGRAPAISSKKKKIGHLLPLRPWPFLAVGRRACGSAGGEGIEMVFFSSRTFYQQQWNPINPLFLRHKCLANLFLRRVFRFSVCNKETPKHTLE